MQDAVTTQMKFLVPHPGIHNTQKKPSWWNMLAQPKTKYTYYCSLKSNAFHVLLTLLYAHNIIIKYEKLKR
jgi:hypothetical protein